MLFTAAFSHLQKLFHERYELSSTIKHRGERGRQRENGLLSFLRETLPGAYGVATGEIIPYVGPNASPQCDIIIYDHLRMPVIGRSDAVQQVPLEAVYAVIECKSIVDKTALSDAGQKFKAISQLPKCPSKTPPKEDTEVGPAFYVFGYRLKAAKETCSDFAKSAVDGHVVTVVALDTGLTISVQGHDNVNPVWLNATSPEMDLYETLVLFYVSLLEDLRTIDLGNPSYIETFYLGG